LCVTCTEDIDRINPEIIPEALYERLQPPKKLLELLKVEMQEIAKRRKQIAEKEIKTLKRTIEDLENKEIKLLDEMLGGKLSRDIYEKLEKKYNAKRREAEVRLSQLEVDYDDPLEQNFSYSSSVIVDSFISRKFLNLVFIFSML